jgi:dUTP pyrophosphatase
MNIRIINKSKNALPAYETANAAGMDLRADLENVIFLQPMERKLIPTGLHIELPVGYEAQIRPRSGLAYKNGISIVNSPGTIDADYRGEIKVLLVNLSTEPFEINTGDRIAQMVVAKHEQVEWKQAEELTDTARGDGGYGHTGK